MFRKVLLATLLSVGAATIAKAQYVTYEPNYPNSPSQPTSQNAKVEVQIMTGYIIDPVNNTMRKIRLKVAQVQESVVVAGLKELSAEYWSDYTINRPVAQKLLSYEKYADQFEYSVYVPVLGKVVYF
ncbi:MAG: hypothetical protein ACRYGB_04480 [Janthinobacterium lividum]